jgi:Ser/Thr protein kinase RdoA (MazF antagonist)
VTDFYQQTPQQQGILFQQLAAQSLSQWGLQGAKLEVIKMRENAVFRVDTEDGRRHALRVHRAGYHSDLSLRSEFQWMKALDEAGIEVPRVLPTKDGHLFIVAEFKPVGETRQIDLFDWVEGEQLGNVQEGLKRGRTTLQNNYRTLGTLAGRIHNQASSWQLPPGFNRHAWDKEGLVGENPLWGRFWELEALSASERHLMQRARERIEQDLTAYGKSKDNFSMIHADLIQENVLADGDHVRLIDFDDAGFGWHLFELATSLYFNLGEDCFDVIQASLIEGYRLARKLSTADVEKLPLFLLARGTTYLGWVHTRSETETAQELTPQIVEVTCSLAENYLSRN